jgi:hypothetical protein
MSQNEESPDSEVKALEIGNWRLKLALPTFVHEHRDHLIAVVLAAAEGQLVQPMRRSRRARTFQTQFAAGAHAPISLFVKVIDAPRGGRRLRRMRRGSLACHVVRITGELESAGIAAPAVWISGYDRGSGRELLVTQRAEGDGPLRTLAGLVGAVAAKRALLRALGVQIARLHRGGFVHGDLTPFNIFIVRSEPARFVLLDHEGTRRSFFIGRTRRQVRNFVQLGHFNLPGLTRTDRLRVLTAYAAASNSRDPRTLTRRINAMLVRRIRRDGGLVDARFSGAPKIDAAQSTAV